jgi:hypothetical protein
MQRSMLIITGIILYFLSVALGQVDINGFLTLIIWLASLILIFSGVFKPHIKLELLKKIKFFDTPKERYLFLFILAVGVFFRFYKLETLPYGLWLDEIAFSLRALEILEDKIPAGLFQTSPMIQEGWVVFNHLYIYFVILIFKIVGINYLAIKLVSILPSIGIIVASYFLFRQVSKNTFTPMVCMFLISVSHWSVTLGRWGWNEVLMSKLQVLSYYYIIRGIESKEKKYLAIGGMLLGLTFYTYIAFSLVFGILMLFLFVVMLYQKDSAREYLRYGLIVIAASMIVILPGSIDYIKNPSALFNRINEVSIVHHIKNEKSLQPVLVSTINHLKMFHFKGDPENRHNTESWPQLDFITGALFIVGLLIGLKNINKSYNALLIIWLVLGLMGGIFSTYYDSPHAYRTGMIIPVVMYYSAQGFRVLYELCSSRYSKKAAMTLVCSLLAVLTAINFYVYFIIRPQSFVSYNSTLNPEDIIVARQIKQIRDNNNEAAIFVTKGLTSRSYTALLLNYLPPVFNKNGQQTAYGLDHPFYSILPDRPSSFFSFYNKQCYVIYPEEFDYVIDELYPEAKKVELKDPFGQVFAYQVYLTPENFEESKGFYVSQAYPQGSETDMCGATVLNYGLYSNFYSTNSDIQLYVDYNPVISQAQQENRIFMLPNSILLARMKAKMPPSQILENIKVKAFRDQQYIAVNKRFQFYKYALTNGLKLYLYKTTDYTGIPEVQTYVQTFDLSLYKDKGYQSAIWDGYLSVETPGRYKLKLETGGVAAVYLDGQMILSNRIDVDGATIIDSFDLDRGLYKLSIKSKLSETKAQLQLKWQPPNKKQLENINFKYILFSQSRRFCG